MKVRTLFISDLHLGLRAAQPDQLLKFLKTIEPEKIYLVGDIIDGWALSKTKSNYWPLTHNELLLKILQIAKTKDVIYIPGNHDEFLKRYCDLQIGNIYLKDHDIHETVTGKKYLVIHGDQFDVVIRNAKWLAHVGTWAYDFSIKVNEFVNVCRKLFGKPYWSLSSWLKVRVKEAVNFIGDYEENLSNFGRSKNVDGIICGHIHHANYRQLGGFDYFNTGDWVESCTGLIEHLDGKMELIRWKVA